MSPSAVNRLQELKASLDRIRQAGVLEHVPEVDWQALEAHLEYIEAALISHTRPYSSR